MAQEKIPLDAARFEKGMTWKDYLAQMGDTKARTFEEILLATKVIDQAALDKARNFAKAIGVEVRDALVQQKLAKAEAVLPAYAESIGLPYLDLTDIPLKLALIGRVLGPEAAEG